MSLRITSHPAATPAHRFLDRAVARVARSSNRLSSGLRIATAADDAAGLAMSERLRARVRSYDQARRNAADGVSLLRVADGALGSVGDLLVRMRELATQAANGVLGARDRLALDGEYQALRDEVTRIGETTQFNGIGLLDGSRRTIELQVGAGVEQGVDTIGVDVRRELSRYLGVRRTRIHNQPRAAASIRRIDRALDRVLELRGRFGAAERRLGHSVDELAARAEAAAAAESRIRDVDVAREAAALTRGQVLRSMATAVVAQANAQPASVLRLLSPR